MTLSELQSLVHYSTKADVQLGLFRTLANNALKQIQQKRSFSFMKKTLELTIAANSTFTLLPPEFKEPQGGKTPLRAFDPSSSIGFERWYIHTKQEVLNLELIGTNTAERKAYIDFDSTTGQYTLNIGGRDQIPISSQITQWELDAYCRVPDLQSGADTNPFLTLYPDMVLEKTKELSFTLDNKDELAEKCRVRFLKLFGEAAREDGVRETRGRVLRMGGA